MSHSVRKCMRFKSMKRIRNNRLGTSKTWITFQSKIMAYMRVNIIKLPKIYATMGWRPIFFTELSFHSYCDPSFFLPDIDMTSPFVQLHKTRKQSVNTFCANG